MTTEKCSADADALSRDTDSFSVNGAIRKIGAMEDIRAYVYRALIDIMPDRIYAKDRQSRFIVANRAVAHLMGKKGPEDLIGKTDFDFYPPEMAAEFIAVEKQIFQSGEPLIAIEQFTPNLKTGEPGWAQTTKVPLRDFEGNVIGLVGLARDITLRKQYEEEIKRQNAELAEANEKLSVAHEQLLASDQLAQAGRLAATVAGEANSLNNTNNPVDSLLANFDQIEARMTTFCEILDAFSDAQRSIESPEVAERLNRLCEKADLGCLINDSKGLISETREGLTLIRKIVQDLKAFSPPETSAE